MSIPHLSFLPSLPRLALIFWLSLPLLAFCITILSLFTPPLWPYMIYIHYSSHPWEAPIASKRVQSWKIWQYFRDYFPVKIVSTEKLDKGRKYLCVAHPHGILPLGLWSNFATRATDTRKLFPDIEFHLCTLDSNFTTPLLREIMIWCGMIPVSERSIRNCLARPGHAVIDVVGGSAESLDQKHGTARLTLKNRSGFLRIAIEEGADLVPVFTFGDNNIYEQTPNPRGSVLRICQEVGKRIIGMSPTVFWGISVDGSDWGFLPKRVACTTVVGKPVRVKQSSKASEEMIDELRTKYIKGLRALYDRYKDEYDRDRTEDLQIID